MSVQSQEFVLYHGEDGSIVLTGTDNTNPTAWALAFTVSEYPGQSPVVLTITSITVGGSGPYTLTVPFTRLQTGTTLTKDVYVVDLWRTDGGSNRRLAGGKLTLIDPVRLPS